MKYGVLSLLSLILTALLPASVSAMSNSEFARLVQSHIDVLKSGREINSTKALCRNLSDSLREVEPKCVAYSRYQWEKTSGPNSARIK
jgi:hypothetical protein